ncbi:hypothetical protein [Natronomonas amylolytica]|uniref:hypothetical protein n=1 Tax=Natronomonas amylolytica TaxID=3108498 RepID=UPI00300AD97D
MASGTGVIIGLFIIALSIPMLVVPEKAARFRHRHATDPEPTEAAITNARRTGVVTLVLGILVAVTL